MCSCWLLLLVSTLPPNIYLHLFYPSLSFSPLHLSLPISLLPYISLSLTCHISLSLSRLSSLTLSRLSSLTLPLSPVVSHSLSPVVSHSLSHSLLSSLSHHHHSLSLSPVISLFLPHVQAMTVIVRDFKKHDITENELRILLSFVEEDVHDYQKQSTAFPLLKVGERVA